MKKTAKFLLVSVLLFGMVQGAEAQFLNRLKNRIVEEAERVVIDKAADKAAEKTGQAMDKVLSPDINIGSLFSGVGSQVDVSQLPAVYRFDYLYTMQLATDDGELEFDYLLSETEPYMGMKPNMGGDVTIVIDEGSQAFVTVSDGYVFAMAMNTDEEMDLPEEEPMEVLDDYTITQLPNRTFLGHDCVGYKLENSEHTMTLYVAPNMRAGFGNMFQSKQTNVPSEFNSLAQYQENGLVMYMELAGKGTAEKGSTDNATMECVAFEEQRVEIKTR